MLNRRVVVGLLATMGVVAGSANALAEKKEKKEKKKSHKEARGLLGDKVKKNGKHKIDKVGGKIDVVADVNNGKVVGLTATDLGKGDLPVKKVKSKKKLADLAPGIILAQMHQVQYYDYYYGYWFDDGFDEYYYWFPVEYVIVDDTWIEYY